MHTVTLMSYLSVERWAHWLADMIQNGTNAIQQSSKHYSN